LTEDPLSPRAIRAGIPRELERVTLRAMAREPGERFASAEEMRRAIGRALGDSTGELRPIAVQHPQPATHHARGPSTFRSWMLVPLVLLVLTAVAVTGGLLFGRLELGGPLGVRPAQEARALRIASARDVDPAGDGGENGDDVDLAFDGDPATAWETERYDTSAFGALKPGVGLSIDLGSTREIRQLTVVSSLSGWTFQIRGITADLPGAIRPDSEGRRSFTVTDGRAVITMAPFRARTVLIWITALVPEGDGFKASIGEIEIRGE
ncbi:MAG: hypothetical protein LC722_01870, partial [Actinobacteria bacterium]|nr:hypothetical protein [Actinomycetota bacterium]